MKITKTFLFLFLISLNVLAQAPEKMSFQAVIRDNNNVLVINSPIGMQISILQGSSLGTSVYSETQTPISNSNGLITLEIGTGTIINGSFSLIDWSSGPYFIKTETDPQGGNNYTITGTQQLLSVPYALYAKTAGSTSTPSLSLVLNQSNDGGGKQIKNIMDPTDPQDAVTLSFLDSLLIRIASLEDTRCHDGIMNGNETGIDCGGSSCAACLTVQQRLDAGQTPISIYNSNNTLLDSLWGKTYQGGLIFHLNTTNGTGLIAYPNRLIAGWGCYIGPSNTIPIAGADGTAIGTGQQNTLDILAGCNEANTAAEQANNFVSGIYSDWFLPSIDELSLIYSHIAQPGYCINYDGGTNYWSSSEDPANGNLAFTIIMSNGFVTQNLKFQSNYFIPVRGF